MRWRWLCFFGFRLALRRLKHLAILREIKQPAQKNFIIYSSREDKLPITQANSRLPRRKLPHRKRETLLWKLLFCVRKRFGDLCGAVNLIPTSLLTPRSTIVTPYASALAMVRLLCVMMIS